MDELREALDYAQSMVSDYSERVTHHLEQATEASETRDTWAKTAAVLEEKVREAENGE